MSGPLSGAAKRRKKQSEDLRRAGAHPNQSTISAFFPIALPPTGHDEEVLPGPSEEDHDSTMQVDEPSQAEEINLNESDSDEHYSDQSQIDIESDKDENQSHVTIDSDQSQVDNESHNDENQSNEPVDSDQSQINKERAEPQILAVEAPINFPTDKERFDSLSEAQDLLEFLCVNGACQPEEKDMPSKAFPKQKMPDGNRGFAFSYYYLTNSLGEKVRRPWLAYSYRGDYCYCHTCWLFGSREAQDGPFVQGTNDWKGLSRLIQRHSISHRHRECTTAYAMFVKDKSVDKNMKKLVDEEAQRWRNVLTRQFGLLKVITGLGLPIRGHREDINDANPGVYLSLLKYMSTFDPVLDQHIKGDARIKYLSKTITEEQIEILAQMTVNKIIDDCKEAKFFTVIADSTPDISHKDQMAVLLRYVIIDRDTQLVDIKESFIGYFHVVDGRAAGICNQLISIMFDKFKLDQRYITGQAFDGASVMSGKDGGVQKLLRNEMNKQGNDFVPYVHCPPHQLNLVLVHAAERGTPQPPIEVRRFFELVQEVYRFFSTSYRRWHLLTHNATPKEAPYLDALDIQPPDEESEIDYEDIQEEIDDIQFESQDSKKKFLTLKSLCMTRWAARKAAVKALLENFGNVLDCLAKLIDEKHDADEAKHSIDLLEKMNWTFLLTLIVWDDVLTIMDATSRLLQAKRLDLFQVSGAFKTAGDDLEKLRSDLKFDTFVKDAQKMWKDFGLEESDGTFKITRVRRVRRMPGEAARDERPSDPALEYKVDVYFHVLDQMVGEIRARAEGFSQVHGMFGFLDPEKLRVVTRAQIEEHVHKLLRKFPGEFTTDLIDQVHSFKSLYFSQDRDSRSVQDYLQYLVDYGISDGFEQFEILTRRFLTLPIGIASAERSFNYLKRIKSSTRASMRQERVRNLAVLAIEKETTTSLDMKEVIQEFAQKKARRGLVL